MREFNPYKKRLGSIQCIEQDILFNVNLKSRRKSCTCNQCGKNSEFQIRFHDVQIIQWSQTSNNNQYINQKQQETKILDQLEGRLKTCSEDYEKFDLQSKKRRRSCYCTECGSLTQYEQKNQNVPLYKSASINNCKKQRKVHLFVPNINMQTKSQFFRNIKQQNHALMYQFSHQTSNITTRLLKQSKLKLSNLVLRLSLSPQLIKSPSSDQSSPQQLKINSFDYIQNGIYYNPYFGSPKKFLSPHRNFVQKLPPIINKIKNEQVGLRKSLQRKRS